MFLVLQFPLGDLRSFAPEHGRLVSPTWPNPGEGQYLRSAGHVRRRKLGGLNNWIGESRICVANRALRFSADRNDFKVGNGAWLEPCVRRFFFDGHVAAKFEIGFRVRTEGGGVDLGKSGLRNLLNRLFLLPVHVPNGEGRKLIPLISAGKELASFYRLASTSRGQTGHGAEIARLVQPGAPMLFIESGMADLVQNPFLAKKIVDLNESEAALSHFWLNHEKLNGREIRCWLMQCKGSRSDYARELRISLLRLNAGRVGLEILLDAILKKIISPDPFSEESQRLQDFLNGVVDQYVRVPVEFQGSSLLAVACQTENTVLAGDAGRLIDTLKTEFKIRRQVWGKTERKLATLATAINSIDFSMERLNIIMGDQIKGDKYEAGQVLTQGRGAKSEVQQVTFNQLWQQNKEHVDLGMLAAELAKLRAELRTMASAPEHYVEIGAIASAEVEAEKGNGEKVYEALAKAGQWSLGVAEKIGIGLATAVLKTSLGV
jgi:hypothetical protein